MWDDACLANALQALVSILSLFTQKFYKIQINWNKIGTGSEQSKLTIVSLL